MVVAHDGAMKVKLAGNARLRSSACRDGSSDGCMSILPHHWVPLKAPRTTPLERKAPALCADRYWQEICPSSPGFDLSPIRSTVTRNNL